MYIRGRTRSWNSGIPPLFVYEEGESFRPEVVLLVSDSGSPKSRFLRLGFFLVPGMPQSTSRPLKPDSSCCGAGKSLIRKSSMSSWALWLGRRWGLKSGYSKISHLKLMPNTGMELILSNNICTWFKTSDNVRGHVMRWRTDLSYLTPASVVGLQEEYF